ncbi:type V CRISPR-associated protein Cas12d [Patescibacteria group bacterium]|nr:type V CRISPR-associated protein Cas12d [Patescibacteria group bacterium]
MTKHSRPRTRFALPTGYRLHAQRLGVFSGSDPIRTFKYKLKFNNETQRHTLIEQIFAEYRGIEGVRTVDQWHQNPNSYSIIDFWFDSLCVGGLFQPKEPALMELGCKLAGSNSSEGVFFNSMPPKVRQLFDRQRWITQFTKEMRSNGKNRPKRFLETLADGQDPENATVERLMGRWIESIPDGTGISREAHLVLVSKIFGADNSVFSQQQPTSLDLTYLIEPRLPWRRRKLGEDRSLMIGQLETDRSDLFKICHVSTLDFLIVAGLSDNGNALSNFLNIILRQLREGNIDAILKEMAIRRLYSTAEQEEVRSRLVYLSEQARKLPESQFAPGWHEHRSTLVGRLSSYLSNRKRLINERKECPQEIQKELAKVVANEKLDLMALKDIDRVTNLLGKSDVLNNPTAAGVVEVELAEIRTQVNRSLQEYHNEVSLPERYPALAKGLPRPVHFPGDDRIHIFEEYTNGPVLIWQYLQTLQPLLEAVADSRYILTDVELERMRKMVISIRSDRAIRFFEDSFTDFYEQVTTMQPQQVFWQSTYSRAKCEVIVLRSQLDLGTVAIACQKALQGINPLDCVRESEYVVDIIEFARRTAAITLRILDEGGIEAALAKIKEISASTTFFEEFQAVVNSFPSSQLAAERWTQRFVSAKCRGLLSQVSRKSFTSRAVIQTINGSQSTLAYCKEEQAATRYAVRLNLIALKGKHEVGWKAIEKSGVTNVRKGGMLTELSVGTYQRQFLDETLHASKLLRTKVSGASLIAEKELVPLWDENGMLKDFSVGEETVYQAQPFVFETRVNNKIIAPNRYLGLDVGEYGIAWCVIGGDVDRVSIIAAGWIEDPQYFKLQREVKRLRKKEQPRGTLTVSSTKIARIRESLVGSLRNRIHALVLRYHARPVYEHEIDAFETGGNRIKKVYASVKKADVALDIAGNALRASLWGTKRMVGLTVAAGGTSQTCSSCKRWYRDFFGKDVWEGSKRYEVEPVLGHPCIFQVTIQSQQLYLYYEAPNPDESQTLTGNQLVKAIKQYLRPPMKEEEESAAVRHAGINQTVRLNRGSSHQFICPFSDCDHHADADLQAAYNIAVKGWLKGIYKDVKKSPAGQARLSVDESTGYSQKQWEHDIFEKKDIIPAFKEVALVDLRNRMKQKVVMP